MGKISLFSGLDLVCTYSSHLDPTYFVDYLHVLWIVKLQERPGGHSLLLVIDFVMRSEPIKET